MPLKKLHLPYTHENDAMVRIESTSSESWKIDRKNASPGHIITRGH